MSRKRVPIFGEEFLIEAISQSVVRVDHRDQVGWMRVAKDPRMDSPFGAQTTLPDSLDEGVGRSVHPAGRFEFPCHQAAACAGKAGFPADQRPSPSGNGSVGAARIPGGAGRRRRTVRRDRVEWLKVAPF